MKRYLVILGFIAALLVYWFSYKEKSYIWGVKPFLSDGTWRVNSVIGKNILANALSAPSLLGAISLDMRLPNTPISNANYYFSYPQGFILPLFLYFKISGGTPTLDSFHYFSLFNQFLVIFFLSAAIFFTTKNLCNKPWLALTLALSTQFIFTITRATYFWYPGTWWPDTAALTAVSLLLFWAVSRSRIQAKQWRIRGDCFIFFICFFTEWYSLIAATIYLLTQWNTQSREELKARLAGAAGAMTLYIIPIFAHSGWHHLKEKFLVRANLDAKNIDNRVIPISEWLGGLLNQLSSWPTLNAAIFSLILIISGAYLIFIKKLEAHNVKYRETATIAILLTLPALLHMMLLSQHYQHHPYEALKFAMPTGALVPALIPAVFYSLLRTKINRWALLAITLTPALVLTTQVKAELPKIRTAYHGGIINIPQAYLDLCNDLNSNPPRKALYLALAKSNETLYGLTFGLATACELPVLSFDFRQPIDMSIWSAYALGNEAGILMENGLKAPQTLRHWIRPENLIFETKDWRVYALRNIEK